MASKATKKKNEPEKTLNFSIHNRDEIISIYFEENLSKFLRKHKKQYFYQLTYIRTFRKWNKSKKKTRAKRAIIRYCKRLPGEVSKVCNIMITMNKHYGWEINKFNAELCCNIHFSLRDEIATHYTYLLGNMDRPMSLINQVKERKAILEQKARGFIHKDDFDGYDEDFAHVVSTADYSLIYPKNILNIPFTLKDRIKAQEMAEENLIFESVYKGFQSIGVSGYTKLQQPKKYVQ